MGNGRDYGEFSTWHYSPSWLACSYVVLTTFKPPVQVGSSSFFRQEDRTVIIGFLYVASGKEHHRLARLVTKSTKPSKPQQIVAL